MVSRTSLHAVLLPLLYLGCTGQPLAQSKIVYDHYHPPGEVDAAMQDFAARYPQLATVSVIGKSKGGTPLQVLEIATQMRKKDPKGTYKTHPDDARILVPIRPGEKGEYSMLGQEGIDNDGDGRVNEDGPGGYDMNRNYGYNWQPNYVQNGAGDYPFCFPETQAVRDFLLKHPNIGGAQNFHNNGGMTSGHPAQRTLASSRSRDQAS